MNCGVACHNPAAPGAGFTGFHMRLSAKAWLDGGVATISPTETDTYKTGVNVVHNSFRNSYPPDAGYFRFKSGDDTKSVVILVDSIRDQPNQMPPIATHAVDDAGVSSVRAWVKSLPP
jgi:mono/diheme cytochrome c family protein